MTEKKPTKKCVGCALNLRHRCALYHSPDLQWKYQDCTGYNNPLYIHRYRESLKPGGAYIHRPSRLERAVQAQRSQQPAAENRNRHSSDSVQ